jgi:hypothetical protein
MFGYTPIIGYITCRKYMHAEQAGKGNDSLLDKRLLFLDIKTDRVVNGTGSTLRPYTDYPEVFHDFLSL